MKKIFLTAFAFSSVFFTSCDDITDLNTNKKEAASTKSEYLFTGAQKSLVDQMVSTSVNVNVFRLYAQYWTETTYPDESQYDLATRNIASTHFTTIYRDVLRDLKESETLLNTIVIAPSDTQGLARLNNKKALIEILETYSYSVLVDTFGNVPYTEAVDIEAFPNPKYDDGLTIYKDLIARLSAASDMLNTSESSFGEADLIFGGDVTKWKSFANSLRLRLAINLDDTDHAYASAQVLDAVADGIISSNADNVNLNYLGAQPNANPLYADLVVSGRNDFIPANTLVNKMNALADPRRAEYFTLKSGTYSGGVYGASNGFNNYSHIGPKMSDPTFAGTIFDYTEVEFLLAEAVERGIAVGGTAESHYNNAITASMENWGVSAVDTAVYLALPSVAYTTATGTWQQKIGEQAWIGLYNRGFEAWTSYRRLDFPALAIPAVTYNDITAVPKRYTYPAREYTLNEANVLAASTAIGGDNLTNKVFWDKF